MATTRVALPVPESSIRVSSAAGGVISTMNRAGHDEGVVRFQIINTKSSKDLLKVGKVYLMKITKKLGSPPGQLKKII
jgi:hypothetical protein